MLTPEDLGSVKKRRQPVIEAVPTQQGRGST